jgi:FtsP/CotA-like multicopper oxidase with cupredoxin domain
MKITRRSFLAAAAAIAGTAALPAARAASLADRQRLRIPELLDARKLGQSVAFEARAGATAFFPGIESATLGYNGTYLGPTIRVYSGDQVEMTIANRLREPTTVHWHGLLVPGELDGGPHQAIAPGATWRPALPIRQPAATLFYHSHLHHATAEQVYSGLAGVMIVRDADEEKLGLPSEYGIDDLPLVLQDRQFEGGRLVMPGGMMTAMNGARGDTILVNGTPNAFARVPARRVRLRLVNASNARDYHLAFDDGRAFHWIATEGGLLEAPLERRSLQLSPGERAEILVDFSDGAAASLVTGPDRNMPMMGMMGRARGSLADLGPQTVLAFEAGPREATPVPVPARLGTHETWDASHAVRRRRFSLEMGMGMMGGRGMGGMGGMGMRGGPGMGNGMDMFSINGRAFDMARVDERVRLGDLEIWEVAGDMMTHPFHIHGVHFRVLGRGAYGPGAQDAGVKDTVRVDEPVRLLVRFTQPASAAPFMYHCHILEHEDHGMMGQFTVT